MNEKKVDPVETSASLESRFHPPGNIYGGHRPASGAQATFTAAATVGGEKYVVSGFSATLSGVALSAGSIGVYIIDGASGGTTYLWQEVLGVSSIGATTRMSDLNIVGTANTALTIEFSGAYTGGQESVNIAYHKLAGNNA